MQDSWSGDGLGVACRSWTRPAGSARSSLRSCVCPLGRPRATRRRLPPAPRTAPARPAAAAVAAVGGMVADGGVAGTAGAVAGAALPYPTLGAARGCCRSSSYIFSGTEMVGSLVGCFARDPDSYRATTGQLLSGGVRSGRWWMETWQRQQVRRQGSAYARCCSPRAPELCLLPPQASQMDMLYHRMAEVGGGSVRVLYSCINEHTCWYRRLLCGKAVWYKWGIT